MADEWRITVDPHRCIGSGVCAATAPGRFALDETRRSRPVATQVAPDETVLDAAALCPMEAVTVTEPATGRTLFPEGPSEL